MGKPSVQRNIARNKALEDHRRQRIIKKQCNFKEWANLELTLRMEQNLKDFMPPGFEPFEKLIFCSNELENVPIPFLWAGAVPLLIGRGLVPRVWLNSPILQDGKTVWAPLVRDNLPTHEWMQVVERRQQIEIRGRGEILLRCEKLDADSAAVTLLDLRSLGMKIHGTESWLVAGVVKMARNSYSGCGVMLQL